MDDKWHCCLAVYWAMICSLYNDKKSSFCFIISANLQKVFFFVTGASEVLFQSYVINLIHFKWQLMKNEKLNLTNLPPLVVEKNTGDFVRPF